MHRNWTTRTIRALRGNLLAATVAIAAAGAMGPARADAVVAAASDPTTAELRQQIAALQDKLARIEARAAAAAAGHPTDVAATIDAVLRDAERRSHLLAAGGGATAGYDNGFFLGAADGSSVIRPAINAQFRSVSTFREDGKHGGADDDLQSGFEFRRLRFRFDGNLFTKDLTYSFVWDTARNGGSVTLLDAWAAYRFADAWAVRVGQFRASIFRERDVSAFNQLAADRSLADALIAGNLIDRVQGVALLYGGREKDDLRVELAFHDGGRTGNTNFRDTFDSSSPPDGTDDRPDWGVSGRVEWKAAGDWRAYRDFSAIGNKSGLLVLGAGGNVDGAPRSNNYYGTVDAQWEDASGLSAFGALFVRHRDRRGAGAGADELTDYGAVVQVGYLVAPQWEVFGRYDVTFLDEDSVADGAEDTFHEVTVGVNHYLGEGGRHRHRARVTIDLTWLPDGSPSNQDGLGILQSDADEWVVRGQFQLLI